MIGLTLAAVFGVMLIIQTTFFRMFGSFAPDTVLIFSVYCGFRFLKYRGYQIGIMAGLAQDLLSYGLVGVNLLSKGLAGFAAGGMAESKIVDGRSPSTWVIFLFAATVVNELTMKLFFSGFFGTPVSPVDLLLTLFFQSMLNILFGIPIFILLDLLQQWLKATLGIREY